MNTSARGQADGHAPGPIREQAPADPTAKAGATVEVRPAVASGTVRVPGSKSVTHRAYLLAAQSTVPCVVQGPLRAGDPDAMLACLHRLGARVHLEDDAVRFDPAPWHPPTEVLDCRNAGTALRLLAASAARLPAPVALDGDTSLRSRPNGPLLEALTSLRVRVDHRDGRAPFTVRGPLRPGVVRLPGGTSSQFASALLLALPMLDGPSEIHLDPPVASRPYLELGLQVMAAFGLGASMQENEGLHLRIPGGQRPWAHRFTVEGDWSAAAFPLVAAAVTGGKVRVEGLRTDSLQGDRAVVSHLRAFGADVGGSDDAVEVAGGALASPGDVDIQATPDLFPVLAVLAARAQGTTTFTGGDALRHKESDRIAVMARALEALGVAVQETPDGLRVEGRGRALRAASLASHGDHRVHMALYVAGLAADGPVRVDGAGCEQASYPGFHADLAGLGEAP